MYTTLRKKIEFVFRETEACRRRRGINACVMRIVNYEHNSHLLDYCLLHACLSCSCYTYRKWELVHWSTLNTWWKTSTSSTEMLSNNCRTPRQKLPTNFGFTDRIPTLVNPNTTPRPFTTFRRRKYGIMDQGTIYHNLRSRGNDLW